MSRPIVVAITGGSGPSYARRLVEILIQSQHDVFVCEPPLYSVEDLLLPFIFFQTDVLSEVLFVTS